MTSTIFSQRRTASHIHHASSTRTTDDSPVVHHERTAVHVVSAVRAATLTDPEFCGVDVHRSVRLVKCTISAVWNAKLTTTTTIMIDGATRHREHGSAAFTDIESVSVHIQNAPTHRIITGTATNTETEPTIQSHRRAAL